MQGALFYYYFLNFIFPCNVVHFPSQSLDCSEIFWYFSWLPVVGYGINTTLPAHREATVGGNPNHTLSKLLPGPLQELSETQRQMGDQITGSEQKKSWLDFPGAVRRPLNDPQGSLGEGSWSISPEIFGAYPGPAPGHLCHSCTGAVVHPHTSNWADWNLVGGDWAGCICDATWEENIGNKYSSV